MNRKIKKIIAISFSTLIFGNFLVGCGQNKSKNSTDMLEDASDAKVKTVIITQDKNENELAYDAAEREVMDSIYKKDKDSKYKGEVEHYTIPDNFEKNSETEKIFDKIKNDKDVNVLVVSCNKPGLADRVAQLKKERKDILTISSDLKDDDKKLIKDFDLNFQTGDFNHGERIVDLAKSLGAERFVYFISNKELEEKNNIEILDGIKKEAKKIGLPIEEVKIPEMNSIYEEKAFVSNEIDSLVNKYGKKINIYTFNREFDEILATKVFEDKFFISEFSRKNISPELMKIYGLKSNTRHKRDYLLMNSQISTYIQLSSDMERRICAVTYEPEIYTMKMAVEVGDVLKSKKLNTSKAYNSVFLERVSNLRNTVGCGFINKYNGVGNFKIVDQDQIAY